MPEATGKPGTRFHGYILNVVFYGPRDNFADLCKEQFWLGPLLAGDSTPTADLVGRWIGRLPADWNPCTWTPEEFAAEMELI